VTEEAEFPRSHNLASLPLDEQAKLAIDEALIQPGKRWGELEGSFARAPAEIVDDHVAQQVTTLIAQMGALLRKIDLAHATAKEPWLTAGRIIDGITNGLAEQVKTKKRELEQRLTSYQTGKKAEIEREREAIRKADEAKGDPEPAMVDLRQQDRARVTIRSDQGASAHLQDDIEVEIVDPKKIPKRYLMRPKVLAAIAAELKPDMKKGDTVAGAVARPVTKSRVRRG
jgi:hypothetical protein